MNIILILVVVLACMSLVTSRQQQRVDFNAIEHQQTQLLRQQQDYQNLIAKQQHLEQTERIERLAREAHNMERIPSNRTVFVTQDVLQGVLESTPYIRARTPEQRTGTVDISTLEPTAVLNTAITATPAIPVINSSVSNVSNTNSINNTSPVATPVTPVLPAPLVP